MKIAESLEKIQGRKKMYKVKKKMKKLKQSKGITLIALVVTIIVLLILAGVSLNLISGSDGILGRATNAVDQTRNASIKEEAELAMAQLQADYYEGKYVTGNITDEYNVYAKNQLESASGVKTTSGKLTLSGTTVSYVPDGESTATATGTFNTITGEVSIAGTTTDAPTPQLSAVETLLGYTGNTNSNDLEVGDHINYYYKDTNNETQHFECVVLYDKNSPNGIQVVSADTVGSNIILGAEDGTEDPKIPTSLASSSYFEKAKWSYNNAVSTLNSYADSYVTEGGMATDGRCVGSNPLPGHKNDAENNAMITASNDPYDGDISDRTWMADNGWYNSFKLGDEYYSQDHNVMDTLKILNIGKNYWLASRNVSVGKFISEFEVRYVIRGGDTKNGCLCGLYESRRLPGQLWWRACFSPLFLSKV